MKTIAVEIGPDGKMSFDFHGFEGETCETEEAAIRALLGKMCVSTLAEFARKEAERNAGQQIAPIRQKQ
ncbi:DUF2997 domain-containing protein [Candidatus Falkowbacteria bacterium]|nr:DUF2997 domain-containing protein [Candidatus Falkowbacteria bacterium]